VTPGTFILRVAAVDPSNNTLQYSIQDSAFQRFSINAATGDVSVTNTLQRKYTRSAVEFRVRATQTGGSRLVSFAFEASFFLKKILFFFL
jgi:hypothetical protein